MGSNLHLDFLLPVQIYRGLVLAAALSFLTGCAGFQPLYTRPSMIHEQVKKEVVSEEETSEQLSNRERAELDFGSVFEEKQTSVQIDRSQPFETQLKTVVDSYLNVPYKKKGTTRSGMDCSGFVWRVFTDLGYTGIPRTSSSQLGKLGTRILLRNARPGDLLFFRRFGRINHVGIFMGNDTYAHASSSIGISYSTFDNSFFKKRFYFARRIL